MNDTSGARDPFAVLGIEPTLSPAQVKLGYFAALAAHPPHADPAGFRRVRDAYERLSGDGLIAAYLAVPLDVVAEAAALTAELGGAREQALAEARTSAESRAGQSAAFEALLGLEFGVAVGRFG